MATACFRRVTFFLDLPESNRPAFNSCTARLTLLIALRPYFLRPLVILLAKSIPPCSARALRAPRNGGSNVRASLDERDGTLHGSL